MLPMEKSVTFTDTCVNEIIPSINRSFVYKANEGRHVLIKIRSPHLLPIFYQLFTKTSGRSKNAPLRVETWVNMNVL